jgi:katanin p60 ATPase-containing subunit A1
MERSGSFRKSKSRGAIMFFDEFDSFAKKRGDTSGGGGEDIKTQLLTDITNLLQANRGKSYQNFIIAATNFPWSLDDAILRR